MPSSIVAKHHSDGGLIVAKREIAERDLSEAVLSIVSPALIMGLVGSLTYFLLAIGYRGEFIGQMKWTLSFYIFGVVLVARICLLMGNEYGSLYGLGLGAATFAATLKYVEGQSLVYSFVVILVIAGSAYLLTRDCTWMERPDRTGQQGIAAELESVWQLLPPPGLPSRKRRGLSVVWFSLAALPIFGIGQSLIPVEDQQRRNDAFWYMTMYIGCALGLLLTTALVGLRAYLNARKLKMPAAMTTMWVGGGLIIILGALIIGAFIPRPHSETLSWRALGSAKRDANSIAPNAEKGGEKEGQPGAEGRNDNAPEGTNRRGTPDDKAKQKNEQGKKGPGGEKASQKGEGESDKQDPTGEQTKSPQLPSSLDQLGGFLRSIMKWIVIIFVVLLVLFVAIRGLAGASERFRKWLEQLLARWNRKPQRANQIAESDKVEELDRKPVPLSSFVNPFVDGSADGRSDADLIRYSFSALEAWAGDHGRSRRQDETPIEFADVAGEIESDIQDSANRLAIHLARLEYSATFRSASSVRPDLKHLWEKMTTPAATVKTA